MTRNVDMILKMISPEHNMPLDEALHKRILALRGTMIELEKKKTDNHPVPEGSAEVLEQMLDLEKEVCSLPAFMFYCEEVAHAYMLNDDPQKALEYAASALTCAQVLESKTREADMLGLLFKIAVFAKNFRMAMAFLEQKKQIAPLEADMKEAYESLEMMMENGIEPTPRFRLQGEDLPVSEAVLQLLQRGPSEMAARLIRRAGGVSIEDARAEAARLTDAQLAVMFGKK